MHLRTLIQEFVDFLNTQSYMDVGFTIQILPNSSVLINLEYKLEDLEQDEEVLGHLDILTS